MPRKRQLKPSFNDDDDIKCLTDSARLLYALLWGHMDRNGVIEDSVPSIRSKIYPREERSTEVISGHLGELLKPGPSGRPRIYRFNWTGKSYLCAPTMPRHQKIYSDEPAIIPITQIEIATFVDEFEKARKSNNALPQPGTSPATVQSPEQDMSGEHLSTVRPPEQSRASASALASTLNSPSAPTSAQTGKAASVSAIGDKSAKPSDNSDLIKIVEGVILKGSIKTARDLIMQHDLRDHFRDFLKRHGEIGAAVEGGLA